MAVTVWYGAMLKKSASMRKVRNSRFLVFTATWRETVRKTTEKETVEMNGECRENEVKGGER
jgi:hypothetical protein